MSERVLRRWILVWSLSLVITLMVTHLVVGLTGWSPWPEPPQPLPSPGVPLRNLSTPMVVAT